MSDKIPKHIEYLYIPVVDHESCNISVFFKDSFEFIEEERKRTNVLVHCMAGVSRSVTLIIAYIMQKSKTPFSTAFNYVKSKRPIVSLWVNIDSSQLSFRSAIVITIKTVERQTQFILKRKQLIEGKFWIWQNCPPGVKH